MKDWVEQLVTAVATVGVVLLFVLGVHLPRQRALRDLRQQIQAQQQQLEQAQKHSSLLLPLTRQVEQLRQAAAGFHARLPGDGQVGPFLKQVAEQLRQAQLTSLEMRPGSPLDGKRYVELPIRIGFEGSFVGIFAFLAQLENLDRVKRVVDLNLEGQVAPNQGVRADMTLSIYCTKSGGGA